jgi:hypothetical protein
LALKNPVLVMPAGAKNGGEPVQVAAQGGVEAELALGCELGNGETGEELGERGEVEARADLVGDAAFLVGLLVGADQHRLAMPGQQYGSGELVLGGEPGYELVVDTAGQQRRGGQSRRRAGQGRAGHRRPGHGNRPAGGQRSDPEQAERRTAGQLPGHGHVHNVSLLLVWG